MERHVGDRSCEEQQDRCGKARHGLARKGSEQQARHGADRFDKDRTCREKQERNNKKENKMQNEKVINELKRIAEDNGGLLRPQDVVDVARDKDNPLHEYFDWSDKVASQQWRLHQARQLIRVTVEYIKGPDSTEIKVRPFLSLSSDRMQPGGGYRETVVIMRSKKMREQLLEDALAELKAIEDKYASITELAEVFNEIRKARLARESVAA